MGNTSVKNIAKVVAADVTGSSESPVSQSKPKCKACCACPETKRARDECILKHGEEKCTELIEAHKQCMRDQGFNI